MSSTALRRAAGLCVALVGLSLLLGLRAGSTSAVFTGETTNAGSAFAAGWIDPPSGASATPRGYDVLLAWTPGTHGPVAGQRLEGYDNGTSSSCASGTFSTLATLSAAATSQTDASRGSGSANGNWFCYRLVSTSATAWTAQTALAAVQVGLAANQLTLGDGGTSGQLGNGDTIAIRFNQRTTLAGGTVKVCALSSGSILLGDTTSGNTCATGDPVTIGALSGMTIGTTRAFRTSTMTVSTSAPWTATITLAGGSTTSISGTATLTPSSSILSNATTNQATICTAAKSSCRPTAAASSF